MRRRALWVCLAVVGVLCVVAASLPASHQFAERLFESLRGGEIAQSVPIETAHIGGKGPGSLVSAMTMPAFLKAASSRDVQAARVVYRSTNGDTGAETVVSGSAFTPAGTPPPGGWPIVALAHGTTGLDKACAPSLSNELLGLSEPVIGFVKSGYAVAVADYQGLGEDGVHPYTDAKTAGLNVIDSVRALRHTFEGTSNRWLAFGGSQGGGASWAADEQAKSYAAELDLVGAVANSPSADISELVRKAQERTLTTGQELGFAAVVEALARLHPGVNRDDFRSGAAAEHWELLVSCDLSTGDDRDAAIKELTPDQFVPRTSIAADELHELVAKWALPQQPLSAPMSVIYGGKDNLIDAQWTTDAIARACALGGVIDWELQPEKGHGDIDIKSQIPWVAERFAGKPAVNECP